MRDPKDFLRAVRAVTGEGTHGHHDADLREVAFHIQNCLDMGAVSYHYINRLELELQRICKVNHAIAVSSGTAAIEVALRSLGVGPGDKVAVPSMTFVGSVNPILYVGAEPVFVDGDEYGMDVADLEIKIKENANKIKAVIAVDLFGHPADMIEICRTAWDLGRIPVIEDAAEALGSELQKKPCGSLGRIGTLSFNNNKIVTTGGGGAVLMNEGAAAAGIRHMVTTARVQHPWLIEHDVIGWNYRMPNICAALGYSQLVDLDRSVKAKRALALAYAESFEELAPWAKIVGELPGAHSNYWLTCAKVPTRQDRDMILEMLQFHAIYARAAFTPMHRLPMFRKYGGEFPFTDEAADRLICLPSGLAVGRRFL